MNHRVYKIKRAAGWDQRQSSTVRELAQRQNSRAEREAAAKEAEAEAETHRTGTGQAEERGDQGGATEERGAVTNSDGSASSPRAGLGQGTSKARLAPLGAPTATTKKPTKISKVQPEIEMSSS